MWPERDKETERRRDGDSKKGLMHRINSSYIIQDLLQAICQTSILGTYQRKSLFGRNNQLLVERPSIVRHRKRQPLEIESFLFARHEQDHSELDRYSIWSDWWPFMTNKSNLDLAKRNHAVGQKVC